MPPSAVRGRLGEEQRGVVFEIACARHSGVAGSSCGRPPGFCRGTSAPPGAAGQERRFWHWCHFLSESGQFTAQNRLLVARACWHLFPEAFWLRFDRDSFRAESSQPHRIALGASRRAEHRRCGFIVGKRRHPCNSHGIFCASRPPRSRRRHHARWQRHQRQVQPHAFRYPARSLVDLGANPALADGLTPFSWGPGTLLLANRDLPIATARVGPDFFQYCRRDGHAWPHLRTRRRSRLSRLRGAELLALAARTARRSQYRWKADCAEWFAAHGNRRSARQLSVDFVRALPSGDSSTLPRCLPTFSAVSEPSRSCATVQLRHDLQRDLSDLTESAGYVHPSSQLQVVTVATQVRRNLVSQLWFLALAVGCAVAGGGAAPFHRTASAAFPSALAREQSGWDSSA